LTCRQNYDHVAVQCWEGSNQPFKNGIQIDATAVPAVWQIPHLDPGDIP